MEKTSLDCTCAGSRTTRPLPSNEVGEVNDPCQAGCLRSQTTHHNICQRAWHKSMEATIPKGVKDKTKPSNNGIQMTACKRTPRQSFRDCTVLMERGVRELPFVVGTNRQSHDATTDKKKLIVKRSSDPVRPSAAAKSLSQPKEGTPAMRENGTLSLWPFLCCERHRRTSFRTKLTSIHGGATLGTPFLHTSIQVPSTALDHECKCA